MKKKLKIITEISPKKSVLKKNDYPGYLDYPASEDIYNNDYKEAEISPEDISKMKERININPIEKRNEKDFKEDVSGDDLDVPGSELDDDQENIGSEDEENNLYSIGGDNHDA